MKRWILILATVSFIFSPLSVIGDANPSQAIDGTGTIEGKVKVSRARNSSNVVIYFDIEGDFKPPKEVSLLDQKHHMFMPHALPILKGTTVGFKSSEGGKHSIFSDNFNLGIFKKGQTKTRTFNELGEFEILCSAHVEMSAYIVVLPNPYFAKTDKQGNFRIENVPPGKYTLKTWHEKKKSVSREVTVEAGNTTVVDLVLKKRR